MNVSFLQNDPLDTVVVNSNDGRSLYEVRTPWKLTSRVTTIRRTDPGVASGRGHIVAEVSWHPLGSSTVIFLGSTMHLDEFLRRNGIFSGSRTLTGTDGKLYKWKRTSNKFVLVDCHTKAIVAQSHQSKLGLLGSPRKMNIDVHPQGMHTLDAIVVSFLIMEQRRRSQNRSNAAVAASG